MEKYDLESEQEQRIRKISLEIEKMHTDIEVMNKETEHSRAYAEQRFREIVEDKLGKLLNDMNGYPATTFERVKELEKEVHCIQEQLKEALKVKEDQVPKWFRSIIYVTLLCVAPIIGGAVQILIKVFS